MGGEILREEIDAVLKAAEEKKAAAREQAAREVKAALQASNELLVRYEEKITILVQQNGHVYAGGEAAHNLNIDGRKQRELNSTKAAAFDAAWGQK